MIKRLPKHPTAAIAPARPQPAKTNPASSKKGIATLLALSGGSMIGLAWQDDSYGWLAMLGIALIMLVHLTFQMRLRWHFLIGWATGTLCFTIATFWISYSAGYLLDNHIWSIPIGAAIWAYQGLQYGLIALTLAAMKRQTSYTWLAVPVVWLGILTLFPNLYPFLPACLLTGHEALLQLAEFGGVYLVSMYALAIGGFIAWSINGSLAFSRDGSASWNGLTWRTIAGLTLVAIYVWGDARMNHFDRQFQSSQNDILQVGLVQATTHYDISHQRMMEASASMAGMVDLMIWPEGSLGNYSTNLANFDNAEHVFQNSMGEGFRYQPWPEASVPLLGGGDTWAPSTGTGDPPTRFVSALMIDSDQRLAGCRHKTKLMPFGEYIPGESMLPFLSEWLGNGTPITPGTENRPLAEINGVEVGALICCEDMFPAVAAEQVLAGCNLLVTIGNNVVFNSDTVGQQHFRIARFRAIENRVPMLRCMTTGVSGLVSTAGKVVFRLPENQDAAGVVSVPVLKNPKTVFTRWGQTLPFSLIVLAAGLAVFLHLKNEKPVMIITDRWSDE